MLCFIGSHDFGSSLTRNPVTTLQIEIIIIVAIADQATTVTTPIACTLSCASALKSAPPLPPNVSAAKKATTNRVYRGCRQRRAQQIRPVNHQF